MNTSHAPEIRHSRFRTLRYAVPLAAMVLAGCTGGSDETSPNTAAASTAGGNIPKDGSVEVNPAGISLEFVPDPRPEGGLMVIGCDGITDTTGNGVSLTDNDPTNTETVPGTFGAVDKKTYDAGPSGSLPARIGATVIGIGDYRYAFAVSSNPDTVYAVNLDAHQTPNGGFQEFNILVPGDPADNFDVSVTMRLSADKKQADFSVGCLPLVTSGQPTGPTLEA